MVDSGCLLPDAVQKLWAILELDIPIVVSDPAKCEILLNRGEDDDPFFSQLTRAFPSPQ